MPDRSSAVAASTVALGQTVVSYTYFLPRLSEVRRAGPEDSGMRGDVRLGQLAAGVLSLGIGVMLSSLTESTVPLYVTLGTAAIIAVLYEIALRGERIFE